MPELPEVEVCRRGLLPEVEGRTIRDAVVRFPRLRRELPAGLAETLRGRRVAGILRRGKYLLFDCRGDDGDGWLIIHLGMTGNLRFVSAGTPAGRHDHVDLVLPHTVLRYSDPRRFGVVAWHPGDDPESDPLLAKLGVEPLSADFTAEWLYSATRKRQSAIKTFLMDAHAVVGVGNIYASESLFRAGISPLRAAGRVGKESCAKLVKAVKETLGDAIAAGGSSIRDYVHSDGSSGWFQISCGVYDRTGLACGRCGGTVRQIRQAGRSTYYCPGCQH
ncbi:MAG TPA: bifunctional DNA-formamidopyrimidine glycosylase/DNA-(apurinic or apyrimidinic site) lyase [Rhodocyclaceae bacterium]|nr:bifunctional DNA-formamidopyrimidine glycosylase/DNA-(apurinic or apyrimidinic site) lyase [Rhodocyclaceae bacterium]